MNNTTAEIDAKGRILIPKAIRETAKLKKGSLVNLKTQGKAIVIEPIEPVADKYHGVFKIAKWPDDMDEFVEEVMAKWWANRVT